MPRTRSLAWSELKIGVLTIAALVIAAVLVFTLTGTKGFTWQRYTLKTRFPNVAGLATGSPVRVAGVEVGTVTDVTLSGEEVDVTFEVNKAQRGRITDKSVAVLGSVSLLGESSVDISPATTGTPIPDYGYVTSGRATGSMADMSARATVGMEEITGLVRDLRQGKGTAGKLMTDEQLYTELHAFVVSANALAEGVRQGRGTLGKLMNDPKSAQALEASLKNIEDMTRRINAGQGSFGKLLNDDAFASSLTGATSSLRDLTDKINRGEGTLGQLMTDRQLYDRLNAVTNRLDEMLTRLNEGQGTMGQLLKDKQLYENMNKTVAEFQALLTAIKSDPKKYLNVKVSIF